MTIEFIWGWTGTILLIGSCIWSLWRGDPPERWGGGIMLAGFCLSMLADMLQPSDVYDGIGLVAVDTIALIAFFILSLWSRRIWTLFITAFQLNAVISHFAIHLSSHVDMYTQITAVVLWSGYGITFALMAGMWSVERRRRGIQA
jgi:hypothetical protein